MVKFTPVWRTGSSVGQSGGLIIPWSWVQVPPGPPTSLLNEDLPRFVMSWLPNTDDSAVRLNLVNICAGNPDLLRRVDRSRHNRRSHHGGRDDWSRDDARTDDCVSQNAADDPANEPGPEITPSTSPSTLMMMVVVMVRHRCRAMMHHWRRPSAETAVMTAATRAAMMTCEQRSRRQKRTKCK